MDVRLAPVVMILLALTPAAAFVDVAGTPSGEGDPQAVVCRAPQGLAGSRLPGPRACRTNALWAQYRKDGMELSPDGIKLVPGEKYRSLHPGACHPVSSGGGGASTANQTNMSMICD